MDHEAHLLLTLKRYTLKKNMKLNPRSFRMHEILKVDNQKMKIWADISDMKPESIITSSFRQILLSKKINLENLQK